jgi:hydroxymethylbilane synthase
MFGDATDCETLSGRAVHFLEESAMPEAGSGGGQLRVGSFVGKADEARGMSVAKHLAGMMRNVEVSFVQIDPGDPTPGENTVLASALDVALMNGEIDIAAVALQEIGRDVPAGLKLAAVTKRIDCRDAAVTDTQLPLAAMPEGTQVVVDGPRRALQVKRLCPALEPIVVTMRPHSLLDSVAVGDDSAGVIGLGELCWMGSEGSAAEIFSIEDMMPAPGQGALALVIRDGDAAFERAALAIHDKSTWVCVRAERTLFASLEWSSYAPAGAMAEVKGGKLHLVAAAFGPEGSTIARAEAEGDPEHTADIVREVAEGLKAAGALEFVREVMLNPPL